MNQVRLIIVGNAEPIHVGAHLRAAAEGLGIPVELCDTRAAFDAAWLVRQWSWRVQNHTPPRLAAFESEVGRACERFQPTHLLTTGLAPLRREALNGLRKQGIRTLNYLTDDPWNPAHRAAWFMDALVAYEAVFTPRRANMDELCALGCKHVEFLPFGYNPLVHFPDPNPPDTAYASDVLFAGGADADRVPYVAALIEAGLDVRLYGGYWERYRETRAAARGHADPAALRRAVRRAGVCLNLVRRANRDDNVMRSFEVPAMGGCMLTEDTPTHRAVFGAEGEAVLYFETVEEMVTKTRNLLDAPAERQRLAEAGRATMVQRGHAYAHRLEAMLRTQGVGR